MIAEVPLFWIKQLTETLEELKEIPLWGFPSAFPLEPSFGQIAAALHLQDVKIAVEEARVRSAHETTAGFGSNPIILGIELTPLSEPAYWIMGQEEVRKLCSTVLTSNPNAKGFSTPAFFEGFYRFLTLHVAESLDQINAFGDLCIKVISRPFIPQESLCMDVALQLPKQTFWGRIICPHAFRHAFRDHFNMATASLYESALSRDIPLSLSAQAGSVSLSLARWKEIKVGDFIALDSCSFDPSTLKGSVTLCLNSKPLLQARVKAEGLKIVDYAFYHEEIMKENEHFPDEDEPPQHSEEASEGEDHLWSPDEEQGPEALLSTQEIQLSLTVEVARLKINLERLLRLKPGNVLELAVRPEQGVDISIGGKRMAKAELVKLGDILGVKILQLGE